MYISIILPNYNHAPFLNERIDSILNQTFQDFELIILDDKSPDNSKEIIEQYRGNKHISHIIYNEENSGSTFYQWNKGIGLAKGEYIWITESDDYADPRMLQTLYDNITKEENIVVSYCQSYNVNQHGEVNGDWSDHTKELAPELFARDFLMDGEKFIHNYLIYRNVIPNASAVLFSREAFLRAGGAETNIGFAGDWFVWLKIVSLGKIAFTSQILNYYRRHDKSIVTKALSENESRKNLFLKKHDLRMRLVYDKYQKKYKTDNVVRKLNRENIVDDSFVEARYLWVHGKRTNSLKYYLQALRYSDNKLKTIKRAFGFFTKK
ncbi:glycosyltransferase involved in cell wall biosynthesis [Dysgonomonas sp. PFB1-18]|uniref:glycosyltransferase family 2 protein n=1 Tax=unclassified Dysgonomonas TaxID=2630389 RepID=UPI002472ED37|nr:MULTISPECIES: glycosyltransferase [unclassified Dysgonomonas]MDH6309754.1 glycosyltransferase involved in cell wall biosynthesis [Dysgonomonas sp. PF1-14]MDH6339238.1 glycosyltransferase involved in cell wall biosynthesis [Dysgonomonas sp. PF1-16]MDH6380737.1 glycosyltransferase involved in cell wall biosynthesis [Dysgonomonas sp. PFB1-18]MDH6398233.1 glycosyltransferase involved in cell wall biosynthesis [Dysgonomonas sp. PF1-23]